MPAHPWKSTTLLLTILTLLCAAAWVGAQPPQPRPQPANKGEFARQWKEVRAKYPLVAAAHLETLESQVEIAWRLRAHTLCDIPAFANSRLCRNDEGDRGNRPAPEVCPVCKLPNGPGDQERYLSCLEKRINCLS
jgi:hypothetical protein